MHEQLDRETLKLLEKQHRRRALNLRGVRVRLLIHSDATELPLGFTGRLGHFEPDDDEIQIEGICIEFSFDEIIDIRAADELTQAQRAEKLAGEMFGLLEVLEADLATWSQDRELVGKAVRVNIGADFTSVQELLSQIRGGDE